MNKAVLWLAPDPAGPDGLPASLRALRSHPRVKKEVQIIATEASVRTGLGLGAVIAARALGQLDAALRRARWAPVVHVQLRAGFPFFRDAILAARARASGANLVLSIWGDDFVDFAAKEDQAVRALFQRASRILLPGPTMASRLSSCLPPGIHQILPPAVTLPGRPPARSPRSLRVLVSGVDDGDAQEALLAAVRSLPGRRKLLWILQGSRAREAAQPLSLCKRGEVQVGSALRYTGWRRLWDEVGLVVHLGQAIAPPYSLLQGMALGVPCLARDSDGADDALGSSGAGLLLPLEELDAGLARGVGVKSWRERAARAGRRRAEFFLAERVAEQLLRVYEEVGRGERRSLLLRLPLAARAAQQRLSQG